MADSDQNRPEDEIERLRRALDAETRRSIEIQRQLDRANADFEEFVSMAAHNLRESLRDVASYSQLMAETYAGRLIPMPAHSSSASRRGRPECSRCSRDIVDYWATGAGGRQSSRTDMEAVLRQALLCADKQIAERSAIVTHDPLPAVMGDFETLTKVLRHLIGNAIEYCDTPSPRVHISSRRADLEWVILRGKTTVPV